MTTLPVFATPMDYEITSGLIAAYAKVILCTGHVWYITDEEAIKLRRVLIALKLKPEHNGVEGMVAYTVDRKVPLLFRWTEGMTRYHISLEDPQR